MHKHTNLSKEEVNAKILTWTTPLIKCDINMMSGTLIYTIDNPPSYGPTLLETIPFDFRIFPKLGGPVKFEGSKITRSKIKFSIKVE